MTSLDDNKYYAIVVDSGAIIKHTGFQTLHNAGYSYFTPAVVLNEIRDTQARKHLEELPFHLQIREPTTEGLKKVMEFSQRTGDYASLSSVDLQVLALLYDLEKEGCHGNISHVRNEPSFMKKTSNQKNSMDNQMEKSCYHDSTNSELTQRDDDILLTPGRFQNMSIGDESEDEDEEKEKDDSGSDGVDHSSSSDDDDDDHDHDNNQDDNNVEFFPEAIPTSHRNIAVGKTWAAIVNPSSTSIKGTKIIENISSSNPTNSILLKVANVQQNEDDESHGGQFSDAENDDDICIYPYLHKENTLDDDSSSKYDDSNIEISDEECDGYILDPEEAKTRKYLTLGITNDHGTTSVNNEKEFPSLTRSSMEISEKFTSGHEQMNKWEIREIEEAIRRAESLKPISHDGKLYDSFRTYKDIISSTGIDEKYLHENEEKKNRDQEEEEHRLSKTFASSLNHEPSGVIHSRIMGGADMSGQGMQVDDDGEGWITCVRDIHARKVSRSLDPAVTNLHLRPCSASTAGNVDLPSRSRRAACATTDFAMQNVILQMNLELLTVDGTRIRKLKSWVFRCAACYTVYTGNETARLFCGRCGSPSLQRVAASVDGRTGQFRLHLKKNYRHKLRGTQFNLPAPGKGNKFKGDLLLREDQLLYGAWSQKVKSTKTPRDSHCIFGADITSSIGCSPDLFKRDDIKVGFGGKNPNASKFGRERRGKKKKSTEDKACGLRRY